ncbi:hypothetical protein [Maritimibacter sp. UBA3975]|uniref:hypothetical protein n=1 Tax=Maritimibacter sp. UBA3975 TaxID=1946833 RepID=UPI0025C2C857|nr:hypothetical protein [Maritimibacter sp. UBA3975]|tara:strand:- start:17557 stop:18003 length:447 start_codon:yes stop_codon:yes gene_type:complete
MARPRIVLTEDQCREVETLAALLNQDQIADYFGIARNTFRAICDRDEEVLARYKKGKAKAIAHVANGLLQKARAGDTTSAIFYLKTQAGWRDQPPAQTASPKDHTGARDRLSLLLDDVARRGQRVGVPEREIAQIEARPEPREELDQT